MIPLAAFAAYAGALMLINRWVAIAQLNYFALYIERAPPSPTKLKLERMGQARVGLAALLHIVGWSAAGMKAIADRQSDPVLEEARNRYLFRRRVLFVVFVVGFFTVYAVAALAR